MMWWAMMLAVQTPAVEAHECEAAPAEVLIVDFKTNHAPPTRRQSRHREPRRAREAAVGGEHGTRDLSGAGGDGGVPAGAGDAAGGLRPAHR